MGSYRNSQRAARAIQAECGIRYTTALSWSKENIDNVITTITSDGKVNWKELGSAACGLWRRNHA